MNKNNGDSSNIIYWVIGVVTVLAFALLIFLIFKNAPESVTKKTNRELALSCTTDMATEFHIHPTLEIIILGQKQEIPKDVGIIDGCMNALHTHDNTGELHVESPEKRDFTLADFFAVWNKPFNKNQILDYKADDKHIIKETINGNEVGDFENTILRDLDKIVISYEEIK